MKDSVLEDTMKVRGVRGAAVLGGRGEVAVSSIESKELNELIEHLHRTAAGEKAQATFGKARRVLVRTDKQEDLSVFVKGEEALAILTERSRPQADIDGDVAGILKRG
jgi:predicted regulator of Ras-like GTPase activity (Roadblock/LC7/MglB family)